MCRAPRSEAAARRALPALLRGVVLAGVIPAWPPALLPAQATSSPTVTALPAEATELAEPFTHITAVAELRDGRLVVHDHRDARLLLVDFTSDAVTDVARSGAGPREFRGAAPLLLTPGGEVWAWDVQQDRILVISPAGKPISTRRWEAQGGSAIFPRVADAAGRLYGEHRDWRREGSALVEADLTAIVRLTGARRDTIAFVQPLRRPANTGRERYIVRASGFATVDAWGVFADGRVIVVRAAGFRPELHLPDGSLVRAAPIPFSPIAVTAEHRREHLAEFQRTVDDARRASRFTERAERMAAVRVAEPLEWAATKPPLRDPVIHVDGRQRAWVPVNDALEATGLRYDLLDRDGRRVGAVRLPRGERIVAFGAEALYTERRDADDLVYLRRHRLP